jgi:D-alanine-D-alanine ligase
MPPKYKVVLLHNVMTDWNTVDSELCELAVERMRLALIEQGFEVILAPVHTDVVEPLRGLDPREHLVFNWCEGLDGEPNAYYKIPPVLEELGFAYTGADAWSLEATTDKSVAKTYLLQNRVSTPTSQVFSRAEHDGWERYPALVKPTFEHCSFGITPEAVVDTPQQLEQRVEYVLDTWHQPALVEDFIDGPEINASIWGNGRLSVLPLSMLDFAAFSDYHQRLVSYDAKWEPGTEAFQLNPVICPVELEPALKARVERTAKGAYRALRLRDYGRIDMRIRDGIPYVLDVNSNPDLTIDAGFARSARAAGYDYSQGVSRILELAAERMPVD